MINGWTMIGDLLNQKFTQDNAESLRQYFREMSTELGLPAVHSHNAPQSYPVRKEVGALK